MTPEEIRKKDDLESCVREAQQEILRRAIALKWDSDSIRLALINQSFVTREAWRHGRRPSKGDRLW